MNIERMLHDEFELTKQQIKIHEVKIYESEKSMTIELLVKEVLSEECISTIKDFFCDVLATTLKIQIKQIRNHCAEDFICQKVKKFISTHSSFIQKTQSEGDVSAQKIGEKYVVTYIMGERFQGYYQTAIKDKLQKYLYRCFLEDVEVQAKYIPDYEAAQTQTIRTYEKKKEIEVSDIEIVVGKEKVNLPPAYISEVDRESSLVVICGRVENLIRKEYKVPKQNKNDHFYMFTLSDVSGKIICKVFHAKKYNENVSKLEGKDIILIGVSVNDKFAKDIQVVAKKISTCKIVMEEDKPEEKTREANDIYLYVEPEEITILSQENLFEVKKQASERVKSQRIVCFDLETTGLDSRVETILEIGAVEILDGVIKRKFSTLINPKRAIPPIITEITGITQMDVQDAPTIEEAFQDFFKFCDGAILCGHNSKGFDMKFIHEEASRQGFRFDHKVWDTLEIARAVVKGVSKYKLGVLCEHFGIDLTNAHRAYHDAIATAQLLIEIY